MKTTFPLLAAAYLLTVVFVASGVTAFAPSVVRPTVVATKVTTTSTTTAVNLFGFGEKVKEKKTTEVPTEELATTNGETATKGVTVDDEDEECVVPEEKEQNEAQKLFSKIKDAGVAGSISLFLWEGAFWAISIPVAIFGYTSLAGHFPDLTDSDDLAKVGAEAFAFANVARLALPLRIALAVSTIPWVQENIVDRFLSKKDSEEQCEPGN